MPRASSLRLLLWATGLLACGALHEGGWLQDVRQPPGDPRPSPGCESTRSVAALVSRWGPSNGTAASSPGADGGWRGWVPVQVEGAGDGGALQRWFWAEVPLSVIEGTGPSPLLLSFHGQGGSAYASAKAHEFDRLGSTLGFGSAFLQAIDDAQPGGHDEGTAWNVGTAGDDSTCVPSETTADCYTSCKRAGLCGKCNWAGCYDERQFVLATVKQLGDALCIDLSRLYLHGQSNGAMLVHYLLQELPGTFAGGVPWYGLPLLGYGLGKDLLPIRDTAAGRSAALLQLHGRQDFVIPPGGGVARGFYPGWIYEPLAKVLSGWAAVHGCEAQAAHTPTYWDGGFLNFECQEHPQCASGRRVMRCLYDGGHGASPQGRTGDEITIWFLYQFRLTSPRPLVGQNGIVV